MPDIHLDPAEFAPIVEMAVEAAVRRLRYEGPCDKPGRILLNKREAAEALGVSLSTVDRLRQSAGLPSVKLDGLAHGDCAPLKKLTERIHSADHLHALRDYFKFVL